MVWHFAIRAGHYVTHFVGLVQHAFSLGVLTHLAVAEVYGLIIAWFVQKLTRGRAVLAGFCLGIVLYLLNLGIVSAVLAFLTLQ